jgi:hypothetical protein
MERSRVRSHPSRGDESDRQDLAPSAGEAVPVTPPNMCGRLLSSRTFIEHREDGAMFEFALVVLLVMSGAASRAVGGSRRAGWVLMAASLAWPVVNRPIEGPVLVVVARTHGIALTDVLALIGVLTAIWVLSRRPGAGGAAAGNRSCPQCGYGQTHRDR